MVRQQGILALLAALALTTSVQAQTAPPPVPLPIDEGSTVVEALEVVARPPGPALWLVEKDGAKLYVVGAASPLPHQLKWHSPRLDRALGEADLLLTPPEASVGPLQVASFLVKGAWTVRQPLGKHLEDRLPPELKARFVSARTQARKPASTYQNWKPAVAGFILLSDFRQAAGLSEAKPASTIERMAKARKIKIKAMSQYRLGPAISAASKLNEGDNWACLADALTELEYNAAHSADLGTDWANGDLASVRARYSASAIERCILRAPGGAALLDQQIAQSAKTLTEALKRPGTTVAVIDLGLLLPRNGVLDRLQASGATVTSPME